ncbi:MAG: nucleotidyl transferase AbiEii/AbiGii toxin family protein [Bacteroidota bacterium]|nr:nucleotidyl transferase AbiEii/AbiGii toxin family protein [Bacteroidota bacterium]
MNKIHKPLKNIPASVKERLLSIAHTNHVEFNFVLRQYFQERFLFRLSQSNYAGNFVLKGALLLLAYDITRSRPTRDIDFLGIKISNDMPEIEMMIREIASIQYEDGVSYLKDTIKIERIKEDAEYEGIRVSMQCLLGSVKGNLQIDIGFGDKIVYGPNKVEFPVLLDYESPKLQVYSLESAIAEKFEAIVSLGLSSSRMKDYYDILFLAYHHSFKSIELAEALAATFKNRGTELYDYKYVFNANFRKDTDLQQMWIAFLEKRKIESERNFSKVVVKLELFLLPCLEKQNTTLVWNSKSFSWENVS